jgi:hypothetical protein
MAIIGLVLFLFGLLVMYVAWRSDGVSAAVLFLLGLAMAGFGIYALFFEQGEGAGRWLESLLR